MKQLHIISCVEDLPRFRWESIVQLTNFRKYNLSDKARVIVFLPSYKEIEGFSREWDGIIKLFPEVKFFFYRDEKNKITDLMINYNYIPIHRLCSLERHFLKYPELEQDAILYIDSDVIFTKQPNFNDYQEDNINYLSDTASYLNYTYLQGKENDVIPEKLEAYKTINPIAKLAKMCDVHIDSIKDNNNNTGGAQYLLKNVNAKFFSRCIDTCLLIRIYLQQINQEFFPGKTRQEKEDKGFQSFCADMWAIQWELWRQNMPSKTPKWMDFAWSTDEVKRLEDVCMLHNAGIVSDDSIRTTDSSNGKSTGTKSIPSFWKEKYKTKNVFNHIEDIQKIVDNEDSRKYCTSVYAKEIIDTYNTIKTQ